MGAHRHRFTLCFGIIAIVVLCTTYAYAVNELFTIGPNPSTGGSPPNVSISGSNVVVGVIVNETSGSADTVDMSYWAWDTGNNDAILQCTPSSDGPFPISKKSAVTDSCTITAPPGTVGPILFECKRTGSNGAEYRRTTKRLR